MSSNFPENREIVHLPQLTSSLHPRLVRYSNSDIPQHPSMRLVSNSEQNFGGWSRRLITMEKTRAWDPAEHATIEIAPRGEEDAVAMKVEQDLRAREEERREEGREDKKQLGHYAFREKVGRLEKNCDSMNAYQWYWCFGYLYRLG